MERVAVMLSGEHPALAAAELQALLDVHHPELRMTEQDGIAILDGPSETALRRASQIHAWGHLWADVQVTDAGLASACKAIAAQGLRPGTYAVEGTRRGTPRPMDTSHIERTLGRALVEAGATIDLEKPDYVVYAWSLPGRIVVGLRQGAPIGGRFDMRGVETRSHFSPVSLHPRRAASLIHLARIPPGGRLLDPFCGTGGIALEAALEGYDVVASDLDPFMVQGTLQTLADAGPESLPGLVFQADISDVPKLVGQVDGIVTDLPYGRASSSHDEALHALYQRALNAFYQVLRPGGYAVVGHAQPELLADAPNHGLAIHSRFAERAHKSLTRHFVVLQRT